MEIASGVGLVWVRRDGAAVPSVLSVLMALVPVDVAVPSSTVSAAAFVLVPSSALAVSLLAVSVCACCPAVARGCMVSAMAAWPSSRRPWTRTRSRRAGSKGIVS